MSRIIYYVLLQTALLDDIDNGDGGGGGGGSLPINSMIDGDDLLINSSLGVSVRVLGTKGYKSYYNFE